MLIFHIVSKALHIRLFDERVTNADAPSHSVADMLVATEEEKKKRCLRVATHNFPTCSYSRWRNEHNDVYIVLCTLLRDHIHAG